MKKLLFLTLISLFYSKAAWAAACCGGGFAMPATIVNDDRAQLTSSITVSEIKNDVRADGLWKRRDESEVSRTFKVEGAHLLSDRWQAGFSLPVVQRQRFEQDSTGLGDISTSLGYEILPEFEYNPIKPRGVAFLQLTLPTGKSIYESEDIYALDSRGRGFWMLAAGTVLTKTWADFDAFLSTELHYAFQKKVKTQELDTTLKPGWGNTTSLGAGYSWKQLRIGMSLAWSYEDPVDMRGTHSAEGALQRYATGSLLLSYLINDEWAGTLSYADQTFLGSPVNTTLAKTLSFQLQRRWSR